MQHGIKLVFSLCMFWVTQVQSQVIAYSRSSLEAKGAIGVLSFLGTLARVKGHVRMAFLIMMFNRYDLTSPWDLSSIIQSHCIEK
ncbi:MAG: hypothetical protein ACI8SE_000986 [Bacteroidia bacterium]|jgi:hypothetical protein